MDKSTAQRVVTQTFKAAFDRDRFRNFVNELTNGFDEMKKQTMQIPDAFKPHVASCQRIGTYESPESELADVLIVHLTESYKLERTRTALRDFVAHKLKRGDGENNAYKEAALVAFVAPDAKSWRFSFVRMEYETKRDPKTGRIKPEERLTPARRFSYLVGAEEECHTAQARFLDLLKDTSTSPILAKIEEAFSVESVTKEFFNQYAALFQRTHTALEAIVARDKIVKADFQAKGVCTVDFAKKLLGQIVFLYFIQKKGWLGVPKGGKWGDGPKNFMRQLAARSIVDGKCLFNEVLEPLFYDTLATDRGHEAWCEPFGCRIPFLNGGLFEPISGYDWQSTSLAFSNDLFTNSETTKEGDTGTGILDVFDRYNFTVNEAEPLEKEVAIDPEMLGKVFENLIEENRRKGLGAYYTPREIVHYMCQESLINYLDTTLNPAFTEVPRTDIETFIREGDQAAHYETARKGGTVSYARKLSKTIETHARALDEALKSITVCDPAIGSGAFPVGMMTEIVKARTALTPYFNDVAERTPYHFKRHAIQNSIYGVDIDAGAVEIAKLRLWLSLVVDEEDVTQIKPLPNLDYKVVVGNSLIGVDKDDLSNWKAIRRLETLKPLYFDETDRAKKEKLRNEIGEVIRELTNGKAIFDFEIYFSEVFNSKRGFDVLLANPPYVGQKGNKDIFQEIARTDFGKRFHQRRMDLFYFFIHRALDLGHNQTQIAFITTNYFITATYADKLRKDLYERATFRSLINFNEFRIFESALGQHNMVYLFERGKDPAISALAVTTKRIGFATPLSLNSIVSGNDAETEYRKVKQSELYQGEQHYITLAGNSGAASDPKMAILDKVAHNGKLLGTLCNVFQGIVTGADKVSPKHLLRFEVEANHGEGIFVLTESEIQELSFGEKELQYIRPWFKNSDIRRYYCSVENTFHLIYRSSKHDEDDLPKIKKHLARFKIVLVNRNVRSGEVTLSQYDDFIRGKGHIDYVMIASAMKAGNYCCISYARDEELFDGPKIVSPQRSYQNTFCYNEAPWYASADVYYITPKEASVSLKYVLALVNSRLYFLWLYLKGKRKGEMLELYQKPLSEIPIKRITPDEQQPFIELVDRILAAKQGDAKANTSALEREIDELVYALYDLTPAEIALVESSAKS